MTIPTTTTYEERVAKGAAWLDKMYGPGWADIIHLETLRMPSTCDCILGQLEGDYHNSPIAEGDAEEHGFILLFAGPDENDGRGFYQQYELLEQEWVRLIRERRGEEA